MASRRAPRLRDRAVRADTNADLVATAKLIRRLLPGDMSYGDDLSAAGDQLSERLGRQLSDFTPERPSVMREVGLGALQAWQALSESQRRRRGTSDMAILFTDLVGFSSWALDAGDEAAIALLKQVGVAEHGAVLDHDGIVVKRLGDGTMAVFSEPEQAVEAAHDAQRRLSEIEVDGHSPQLRAGVHLGRPRKVGKDYLGVDVNVAARVGDAAKSGEVLISDPVRERLEPSAYSFGRSRPLGASGAPEELAVCSVRPR
ncbi:MAG TPA: adenylate/guanylate cyclase domain-containing protein [Solirubrobacterales bacterium]|jgi:adenylate cyclase|nr:adenylate/guanylate cyclase domain-containing protein [Solirubrobacterales bacterium]